MLKVLHKCTTMGSSNHLHSSMNKRFLSLQEYLTTTPQMLPDLELVCLEVSFWTMRFLMILMLLITLIPQTKVTLMQVSKSLVKGEVQ